MKPEFNKAFTLMETLVAIAILAITTTTLYAKFGDISRQHNYLQNKVFATWIATNKLASIRVFVTDNSVQQAISLQEEENIEFAKRNWRAVTTIEPTEDNLISRVEVSVYLHGEDSRTAFVVGFLATRKPLSNLR